MSKRILTPEELKNYRAAGGQFQPVKVSTEDYSYTGFDDLNRYDEGLQRGMDQNYNRAINQTAGEEALNQTAKTLAGIIPATIGNIGAMFDVEDYMNNDREMGNAVTRWADGIKESLDQALPVYRENPEAAFDWGDSAWWISNAGNLIESAASFALAGAAAGGVVQGAGQALRFLSQGTRAAGWMSGITGIAETAMTATMLNQAEALGSATQVWQDTYDKILQETGDSEFALKKASDSAALTMNINRANILLNLTTANLLLKPIRSTRSLRTLNPASSSSMKEILSEGMQEYAEETINYIAEQAGTALAEGKEYGFEQVINDITSAHGIEAGVLGFVGGVAQTGLMRALNGKGIKERNETAELQQQYINGIVESSNEALRNENVQDRDKAVAASALAAFATGSTDHLLDNLKQIEHLNPANELDKKRIQDAGLSTDPDSDMYYAKVAKNARKDVLTMEKAYLRSNGDPNSLLRSLSSSRYRKASKEISDDIEVLNKSIEQKTKARDREIADVQKRSNKAIKKKKGVASVYAKGESATEKKEYLEEELRKAVAEDAKPTPEGAKEKTKREINKRRIIRLEQAIKEIEQEVIDEQNKIADINQKHDNLIKPEQQKLDQLRAEQQRINENFQAEQEAYKAPVEETPTNDNAPEEALSSEEYDRLKELDGKINELEKAAENAPDDTQIKEALEAAYEERNILKGKEVTPIVASKDGSHILKYSNPHLDPFRLNRSRKDDSGKKERYMRATKGEVKPVVEKVTPASEPIASKNPRIKFKPQGDQAIAFYDDLGFVGYFQNPDRYIYVDENGNESDLDINDPNQLKELHPSFVGKDASGNLVVSTWGYEFQKNYAFGKHAFEQGISSDGTVDVDFQKVTHFRLPKKDRGESRPIIANNTDFQVEFNGKQSTVMVETDRDGNLLYYVDGRAAVPAEIELIKKQMPFDSRGGNAMYYTAVEANGKIRWQKTDIESNEASNKEANTLVTLMSAYINGDLNADATKAFGDKIGVPLAPFADLDANQRQELFHTFSDMIFTSTNESGMKGHQVKIYYNEIKSDAEKKWNKRGDGTPRPFKLQFVFFKEGQRQFAINIYPNALAKGQNTVTQMLNYQLRDASKEAGKRKPKLNEAGEQLLVYNLKPVNKADLPKGGPLNLEKLTSTHLLSESIFVTPVDYKMESMPMPEKTKPTPKSNNAKEIAELQAQLKEKKELLEDAPAGIAKRIQKSIAEIEAKIKALENKAPRSAKSGRTAGEIKEAQAVTEKRAVYKQENPKAPITTNRSIDAIEEDIAFAQNIINEGPSPGILTKMKANLAVLHEELAAAKGKSPQTAQRARSPEMVKAELDEALANVEDAPPGLQVRIKKKIEALKDEYAEMMGLSSILDKSDKTAKVGSLVEYKGETYIISKINKGKVSLIRTDGSKYRGNPAIASVAVMGSYSTIVRGDNIIIDTDKGSISLNDNKILTDEELSAMFRNPISEEADVVEDNDSVEVTNEVEEQPNSIDVYLAAVDKLKAEDKIAGIEARILKRALRENKLGAIEDENLREMAYNIKGEQMPEINSQDVAHKRVDAEPEFTVEAARARAIIREYIPESVISDTDLENMAVNTKSAGVRLGATINGIMYLRSNTTINTAFHEAFHVVFRTMLSEQQREELYSAARSEYTPTYNELALLRADHPTLSSEEIELLFFEEKLAEGFERFMQGAKATKRAKSAIRRFWEWLKNLLSFRGDLDVIEDVYTRIRDKQYANAKPVNIVRGTANKLLRAGTIEFNDPDSTETKHRYRFLGEVRTQTIIRRIAQAMADSNIYGKAPIVDAEGLPMLDEEGNEMVVDRFDIELDRAINEVKEYYSYAAWDAELEALEGVNEGLADRLEQELKLINAMFNDRSFDQFNKPEIKKRAKFLLDTFNDEVQQEEDMLENNEDDQPTDRGQESWQREVKEIGGITSLSGVMRNLLAFSDRNADEFGLGLNTDRRVPINPYRVYGILDRLLADTPKDNMLAKVYEAARDNPELRGALDNLLTKMGNKEWKPGAPLPRGQVYSLFTASFDKASVESLTSLHDPDNNRSNTFESHRRNASALQYDQWLNSYKSKIKNKDAVKEAAKRVEELLTNSLTLENLEETSDLLKHAFEKIGIKLSRGYIRWSTYDRFVKAQRANASKGFPTLELTDAQLSFYNTFNDGIIEPISNILKGDKGIGKNLLLDTILSDKNPFLDKVIEETGEKQQGIRSKMYRLAESNAILDETVGESTFVNSENKKVYNRVLPNYTTLMIQKLALQPETMARFLNLPKDQAIVALMEDWGFEEAFDAELAYNAMKNNYFLRNISELQSKGMFTKRMKLKFLDGVRQTMLDENGKEKFSTKKRDGKTWGSMSTADKALMMLNMFAKETKRGTAFFNFSVNAEKRTQFALEMPVGSYFYEGKFTKTGMARMLELLQQDYDRLRAANDSSEFSKEYQARSGKLKEKYEKLYHFRHFPDISSLEEAALAGKEFSIEDATKVLEEGMTTWLESQLEYLDSLGILENVDAKYKTKDGWNETEVYNAILNDYINSANINQLLKFDEALYYKNYNDVVKRNSSLIASGPSLENRGWNGGKFKMAVLKSVEEKYDEQSPLYDGENTPEQDVTDAQSHSTVQFMRRFYLEPLGKWNSEVAAIVKKIERGLAPLDGSPIITETENQILLKNDAQFTPRKLVYRSLTDYVKTSVNTITRYEVSQPIWETTAGRVVMQELGYANKEEAYAAMVELFDSIEALKEQFEVSPSAELEAQIREKYQQWHKHWTPLPTRERLHNKLTAMELDAIDFVAYDSAIKMNKRRVTRDIQADSTITLDSLHLREQVATGGVKTKVIDGTQKQHLIASEQSDDLTNFHGEAVAYRTLGSKYREVMAERARIGWEKIRYSLLTPDGRVDLYKLKKAIEDAFEVSGADEFLQELANVTQNYNLNVPVAEPKAVSIFNAFMSKNAFKFKKKGYKGSLVASHGYQVVRRKTNDGSVSTKTLRTDEIRDGLDESQYFVDRLRWGQKDAEGRYYAEIIIPAYVANKFNVKPGQPLPKEVAEFIGVRIPTQDKHSMAYMKVVDVLPNYKGNAIVLPAESPYLSGEDFDIDAKYLTGLESYKGMLFGDYVKMKDLNSARERAYEEYIKANKKGGEDYDSVLETFLSDPDQFFKKYKKQIDNNWHAYQSGSWLDIKPLTVAEASNMMHEIETYLVRNDGNKDIADTPASMDDPDQMVAEIYALKNGVTLEEAKKIFKDGNHVPITGVNGMVDKLRAFEANQTGSRNIGIYAVANIIMQYLNNANVPTFNVLEGLHGRLSTFGWSFGQEAPITPSIDAQNTSINKSRWTKDSPKANPNTAYIFTENINSIGSTRVGGGSAVIRNNPNAIGIVTKKYYTYRENRTDQNKEQWNANFQDTDADFKLFKEVNLEQFAKIDKFNKKIFPDSFANSLASVPNRFALWLQNELLTRYGLVTELNKQGTGLISKSVNTSSDSINTDYLVERRKDFVTSTDDEGKSVYVDTKSETKKTYVRVSNAVGNNIEGTSKLLEAASKIGDAVDKLLRDVLDNKAIDPANYSGFADQELIKSFVQQVRAFEKKIKAEGGRIITKEMILFNDDLGVAGTPDIIIEKADGTIGIIDLKTKRSGVQFIDSDRFGKSDRNKWTDQINAYRQLAENLLGKKVSSMHVLPVKVQYDENSDATREAEVLELIEIESRNVFEIEADTRQKNTEGEVVTAPNTKKRGIFNSIGKRINDLLSSYLSAATDNGKHQHAAVLGLSTNTAGAHAAMLMSGVDSKRAALIIAHPAVEQLMAELDKLSSSIQARRTNESLSRRDIQKIISELAKEAPYMNYIDDQVISDSYEQFDSESDGFRADTPSEATNYVLSQFAVAYMFSNKLTNVSTLLGLSKGLGTDSDAIYAVQNAIDTLEVTYDVNTQTFSPIDGMNKENVFFADLLNSMDIVKQNVFNYTKVVEGIMPSMFVGETLFGRGTLEGAMKNMSKGVFNFRGEYGKLRRAFLAYLNSRLYRTAYDGNNARKFIIQDTIDELLSPELHDLYDEVLEAYPDNYLLRSIFKDSVSPKKGAFAGHTIYTFRTDTQRNTPEETEAIINAFEMLLMSDDKKASRFAKLLFKHSRLKDAGLFRNRGMAKRTTPRMLSTLSERLNTLMEAQLQIRDKDTKTIDSVYAKLTGKTQDELFREFLELYGRDSESYSTVSRVNISNYRIGNALGKGGKATELYNIVPRETEDGIIEELHINVTSARQAAKVKNSGLTVLGRINPIVELPLIISVQNKKERKFYRLRASSMQDENSSKEFRTFAPNITLENPLVTGRYAIYEPVEQFGHTEIVSWNFTVAEHEEFLSRAAEDIDNFQSVKDNLVTLYEAGKVSALQANNAMRLIRGGQELRNKSVDQLIVDVAAAAKGDDVSLKEVTDTLSLNKKLVFGYVMEDVEGCGI